MQVPRARRRAHLVRDDLGQVEPVGAGAPRSARTRPSSAPRRQEAFSSYLRLTEAATGFRRASGSRPPRVGGLGSGPSACQELGVDLVQGLGRRRALDRPLALSSDAVDVETPRCRVPCPQVPGCAVPPPAMLRDAAPPPRRWRKASKPTTAQATPTLSDSRPSRHGDAQGARARRHSRGEPRGLVAQEDGRRHGPVESRVVLPVAHHGGQGADTVRGQFGASSAGIRPHGQGHVEERARPTSAPSWGCTGRPSRRRIRPAPIPRRPPPAARCRRCRGPARRRAHDQRAVTGRPGLGPGRRLLEHGEHGKDRLGRDGVGHPLQHPGPRGNTRAPADSARRHRSWTARSSAPSGDT